MGEFYVQALCYDDIARLHGGAIAQKKWEQAGYQGPYVPGYVAVEGFRDINGTVTGFKEYADSMSDLAQAAFDIGVTGMKGVS